MNQIGSVWRKWDLQVHTPESILNNEFGNDWDNYVKMLFRKAIENNIYAIGITDYFTIEGYKKIKNEYLSNSAKLQSLFNEDEILKIKSIVLFPNIEFRLNKIIYGKHKTGNRVNFHVILSNELSCNDIEEHFLHDLSFVYEGSPNNPDEKKKLKASNLSALGARLKSEHEIFNNRSDLRIGMENAVVDDTEICDILNKNKKFDSKYILALPSDEDLSQISFDGQDHQTRKVLIQKSNCIITANQNSIKWGLGEKSESIEAFINEWKSLKPSIWGSDAHSFDELFVKNRDKYLWIKSDLTFDGLTQILNEPSRVFIGKEPHSKINQNVNSGFYINNISISKIPNSTLSESWFDSLSLNLNPGLVAIIGNKGGGKSALADIIGLCGNTRNHKHFSFLSDKRFRKSPEKKSGHFEAVLTWKNNDISRFKLSDNPNEQIRERIKYIPQSFLDKLCLGEEEKELFENELKKIIFSRLPEESKLGKNTLDEIINFKTEIIRQKYEQAKSSLSILNEEISVIEEQLQDDYQQKFIIELELLNQKLSNIIQREPVHLNNERILESVDSVISEKVTLLRKSLLEIDEQILLADDKKNILIKDLENIEKIDQFLDALDENINKQIDAQNILSLPYNINIKDLVSFSVNKNPIQIIIENIRRDIDIYNLSFSKNNLPDNIEISIHNSEYMNNSNLYIQKLFKEKLLANLQEELGKPEREYQIFLTAYKDWENEVSKTKNEITKGKENIKYIQNDLPNILQIKYTERLNIIKYLFERKQELLNVYRKLFEPITQFKDSYKSRLQDYKIDFDASLMLNGFYEKFDQFINNAKAGSFYSKEAGLKRVSNIVESFDLNHENGVVEFVTSINNALHNDLREPNPLKRTVKSQLKQGLKVSEFYNFIFSLDYLDPMFQLKLGDKEISSLSPGERGALLLIFYLILDNEEIPLVIDQPEENLDNQSIYSILVPFVKEAKNRRQVIIVTHNPNLAVVCDADQIIYVKIDKNNNYEMSCFAGSIENPDINKKIIEVLEGTFPAFDTRNKRYEITRMRTF